MNTRSHQLQLITCAAAGLLSAACASTDLDGSDHGALATDVRVKKEIRESGSAGHMYVEGEWVHAQGDTDDFDYSIDTLNAGVGLQGPLGKQGFASSSVGLSLQLPEFETDSDDLDGDLGVGPYGAVEGGWRATELVEPYARMLGAIYFPDASTYFSAELGVRFHVIEHCALFGAWRYAHYSVDGLDSAAGDDSVGLDVTGPVLGLSFSF